MSNRQLILGVDGGGSKTAARIATVGAVPDRDITTIGEGFGGPSNVRAVGEAHAEINLDVAIDAALRDAGTADTEIDYAVLGLAGSSLPDVQSFIANWAERRGLAKQVDIVHDADPVLAVAAPDGRGIALIVGTGSVAIGADGSGERSITGGWGHWFGDTGSGYDLGRRALSAVADAVDGVGPETELVSEILQRLRTDNPREILQKLGMAADVRREIASLAPTLMQAASSGDAVALAIVQDAADATARLVHATAKKLDLDPDTPLAVAGGIVCSNTLYRETLLASIRRLGESPTSIVIVDQPVEGCLLMARDRLLAGRSTT
jgi:N-acetylglucosamine kinase-like BadF-type ATPase